MTTTTNQIEDFRNQLKIQRVTDFFESIANPEDDSAELESLLLLSSKVITRLAAINQKRVDALLSQPEFCPGCLIAATLDLASVQSIADEYNKLVDRGLCASDEETT